MKTSKNRGTYYSPFTKEYLVFRHRVPLRITWRRQVRWKRESMPCRPLYSAWIKNIVHKAGRMIPAHE